MSRHERDNKTNQAGENYRSAAAGENKMEM